MYFNPVIIHVCSPFTMVVGTHLINTFTRIFLLFFLYLKGSRNLGYPTHINIYQTIFLLISLKASSHSLFLPTCSFKFERQIFSLQNSQYSSCLMYAFSMYPFIRPDSDSDGVHTLAEPMADEGKWTMEGVNGERPEWMIIMDHASTIILTCNTITLMMGMGAATYWREVQ